MKQIHIDTFNKLDAVGKKPGKDIAKKRGEEFEILINDIFQDENVIIHRSYRINKGVYEQIDGAIKVDNRIILIEVKWVESGIAASELYSFMGKVDNKFDGTIGLFISREKLSDSVLMALHKGRRQRILVIHGEDIDLIFDNNLFLGDYLKEAIHEVSIRNESHFPISKYLSRKNSNKTIQSASADVEKAVSDFISKTILDTSSSFLTNSAAYKLLTKEEKIAVFKFILNQFPQFYEFRTTNEKGIQLANPNALKNASDFMEIYLEDDEVKSKVDKELVKQYYSKFVINSPKYYCRPIFTKIFAPEFEKLDEAERKAIGLKFLNKLMEIIGSYDDENQLTIVIQSIWLKLDIETKESLKKIYLSFYVSSREARFPQVSFAKLLLDDKVITEDDIIEWLTDKVAEDYESYLTLGLTRSYESIAENYIRLANYLDINEINWSDYVKSLFGAKK